VAFVFTEFRQLSQNVCFAHALNLEYPQKLVRS
jgi:hypothetical protein